MENFRFTLFNGITLFILALTIAIAIHRIRARKAGNWPLAYYVVALGFAFGFPYSLNLACVFAGLALALAIRLGFLPWAARWAELAIWAYVLARCMALLLMW
jgi:hypothetical protein